MQRLTKMPRWIFTCLILVFFPGAFFAQNGESDLLGEPDTLENFTPETQNLGVLPFYDGEVKERLGYLSSCLPLNYTAAVRSYLSTYFYRKRDKAEILLGKRLVYFPLFEQKLKEHNLPNDLKYLSVVESALNAEATSRVGAAGLWQFMPQTGSQYGLRQNNQVDERNDPVASTDAAMRYLKDLHRQFGDWALALAAYNSGPGRVSSAIKRAHSRNFWHLQRYLPKETANYVPAFIAATYLCNYFQLHNLMTTDPELDLQLTSYLKTWEGMSFNSIADATGLEYQVVKKLNPGYKKDYIPATMEGHYIVLPTRTMTAFVNYLNGLSSQRNYVADLASTFIIGTENDGKYATTNFRIEQADHIDRIGAAIGANGEQIKSWNNLKSNWVSAGTSLKLWRPVVIQKHEVLKIETPAPLSPEARPTAPKPQKKTKTSVPILAKNSEQDFTAKPAETQKPKPPTVQNFQYHTVRRNETLDEIAKKYEVPTAEILKLNGYGNLKIGSRLKIKLIVE